MNASRHPPPLIWLCPATAVTFLAALCGTLLALAIGTWFLQHGLLGASWPAGGAIVWLLVWTLAAAVSWSWRRQHSPSLDWLWDGQDWRCARSGERRMLRPLLNLGLGILVISQPLDSGRPSMGRQLHLFHRWQSDARSWRALRRIFHLA